MENANNRFPVDNHYARFYRLWTTSLLRFAFRAEGVALDFSCLNAKVARGPSLDRFRQCNSCKCRFVLGESHPVFGGHQHRQWRARYPTSRLARIRLASRRELATEVPTAWLRAAQGVRCIASQTENRRGMGRANQRNPAHHRRPRRTRLRCRRMGDGVCRS